MQITCPSCGTLNTPDKALCGTCGATLAQAPTPPPGQVNPYDPYAPPSQPLQPPQPTQPIQAPNAPPYAPYAQPPMMPPQPQPQPPGWPVNPYAPTLPPPAAITSNDRLWSALSYFFTPIVPIVVLLIEDTKSRMYPRYHAVQALGLAVAIAIYSVLATMVFICGSIVTFGFGGCVLWILFILPLPLVIYYTYMAYTGVYFEIPWLTKMMIQQGWLTKPRTE